METAYPLHQLEKFLRIHLRSTRQQPLLQAGNFYHGRTLSSGVDVGARWMQRGQPQLKECYYNAAGFAMDHEEDGVRYAEGYWFDPEASTYIYHAWNVLADGRVIDLTQEVADLHLQRPANLECLYFGIEIPTDFIRRQIAASGCARNYAWLYLAEQAVPANPGRAGGPI